MGYLSFHDFGQYMKIGQFSSKATGIRSMTPVQNRGSLEYV